MFDIAVCIEYFYELKLQWVMFCCLLFLMTPVCPILCFVDWADQLLFSGALSVVFCELCIAIYLSREDLHWFLSCVQGITRRGPFYVTFIVRGFWGYADSVGQWLWILKTTFFWIPRSQAPIDGLLCHLPLTVDRFVLLVHPCMETIALQVPWFFRCDFPFHPGPWLCLLSLGGYSNPSFFIFLLIKTNKCCECSHSLSLSPTSHSGFSASSSLFPFFLPLDIFLAFLLDQPYT